MSVLTHPGIYQSPIRPTRRLGGLARRDVAVFAGFTTRGPAMEPVRITTWRQFSAVFGDPYPTSYLGDALKGYFETGGDAAYVVRVVGAGAKPAMINTGTGMWSFAARTRLADFTGLLGREATAQWQGNLQRKYGRTIPDPGAWGNGLAVRFSDEAEQSRSVDHIKGRRLALNELAGVDAGAVVLLSQDGINLRALIEAVDPLRREIILDRDLPVGMMAQMRMSVQSMTAEIMLNGSRVELFEGLSASPAHPQFVQTAINEQSRFVHAVAPVHFDPSVPDAVPLGERPFSGGRDGLSEQTTADWLAALAAQAVIDEIALISLPDLVRQRPAITDIDASPPLPQSFCHLPTARPVGAIAARVVDAETDLPLEGVLIQAAGEGAQAQSGPLGRFVLDNVNAGLVELRVSKDDYLSANPLVQASADQGIRTFDLPNEDITTIRLIPLDDVPVLDGDQILEVQRAMCLPSYVGGFRMAVLDPPLCEATPEDNLNWAASLGPTARGFAVGPWLGLEGRGDENLRMQPPSGHVCGAFAAAERAQGVHRAPGNVVLRHVKAVPFKVSDANVGAFHHASINLISATNGRGIRLLGGRTLARDSDWQHASVRRLFDALERTLLSRLNWAVFEPHTETSRQILKFAIEQFLEQMRRRGMFAGDTPQAAYSVTCDSDVNTSFGQARDELIADIAIAPTQPYEFILFSLSAQADAIEVTERK